MKPKKTRFSIGILVYPGCLRSGAVVPQDVFSIANTLMQARPAAQRIQLRAVWLSARGNSSESVNGLSFQTEALV